MKNSVILGRRRAAQILLLILAFLLPQIAPPFLVHLFTFFLLYLLLALGMNLIMSYTGSWNFGYAFTLGLGAYSAALIARLGVSPWLSIPIIILLTALVGACVGYPTLRVKGYYYSIITLILPEIARITIKNLPVEIAGGNYGIVGIPTLSIGTMVLSSIHFSYVFLTAAILVIFLIQRIGISRFGRALTAINENETLAESIGINVLKYRVFVNMLSGAIGGFAGALYAFYVGFVDTAVFGWDWSLFPLAIVLFGGRGILGSLLGTLIIYFVSEFLRGAIDPAVRLAFFGLMLVVPIILMPGGISKQVERAIKSLREGAKKT